MIHQIENIKKDIEIIKKKPNPKFIRMKRNDNKTVTLILVRNKEHW